MKKINSKKGWRFRNNEKKYLNKILKSDFSAGSDNYMSEKFETLFAKKHNQKFAISSNSGTSTLHQALHSFGVGHGDEVITTTYTFYATVGAIVTSGAKPVFCEIRPDTLNIDENEISKLITKKTKLIAPIDYAGIPCEIDKIKEISRANDILIMQDSAPLLSNSILVPKIPKILLVTSICLW